MTVARFLNQVAAVLDPQVFRASVYHSGDDDNYVHLEMLSNGISR